MGMEARGERQGRMTVPAAQQFLGTQGRGSPAGELPPQGEIVRWRSVAIAERGSSAQVGLQGPTDSARGDRLLLDLRAHARRPAAVRRYHHRMAAVRAAFANTDDRRAAVLAARGTQRRLQHKLAQQPATWRLRLLRRNVHWVQFGPQEFGHEAARGAHVVDVRQVERRCGRGRRLPAIKETTSRASRGHARVTPGPDRIAVEAAGGGCTGRTAAGRGR